MSVVGFPLKSLLLCFWIALASSASIRSLQGGYFSIDLSIGAWQDTLTASSNLSPKYFICGASLNSFTLVINQKYNCRRTRFLGIFKGRTKCENRLVNVWTRSNGIRLQFCHAYDWNAQIIKERSSTWPWQGMKLCPYGQYVNGFSVKMDLNNGVNGLMLSCETLSGNSNSQILVKDGIGNWYSQVKANRGQHAYQFQLKFGQMLTGISMGASYT